MEFLSKYCWLIPLIVGLLCALLGYLLGRLSSNSNTEDYSEELERCKRRNAQLEVDLASCRKAKMNLTTASAPAAAATGFAAGVKAQTTGVVFDGAAARAAMGKTVKEDDLTVVEGIGPKIRELFHNFDIKTWSALADTSVEKCQEVLNSGGKRFEIHRPDTWPEQAKMAALGQWEALKKWQDEHDYGKK